LKQAESFYAAYEKVGSTTSMLDFEPDGSRPGDFSVIDVDTCADRRDQLLALVVEQLTADKQFARATLDLLVEWQQEVDGEAQRPWLVSRSIDRLRQQVHWLKLLGYDAAIMTATYYAAGADQIDDCTRLVPNPQRSDWHLSRSVRIGQRTEYGLAVRDPRRLPEGRDLHRVLLALSCAAAAGLLAQP
jgi:hypothetical protein